MRLVDSKSWNLLMFVAAVLTLSAAFSQKRLLWTLGAMAVLAIAWAVELKFRRLTVLMSGMVRYERAFPPKENAKLFERLQWDFCYFGVSFATVLPEFRRWYEKRPLGQVRVRVLVADPDDADLLEFQARYQRNLFGAASAAQQHELSLAVQGARASIQATIATLAVMPNVEVRLHGERIRKWVYLIDGEELYLGILQRGRNGLEAPMSVLKRRSGRWTLFDHFQEEWESLWEMAKPAPAPPDN